MPAIFIYFAGAVAALIGGLWIYESPYLVARRIRKWQRSYEANLRQEATSLLRDRILKSDYFDLTEKSALRETVTVKEFFRHFEAGMYDEILTQTADGRYMFSMFRDAEHAIGYHGRPMIGDYIDLFVPVLKELRKRSTLEKA